MSIASLQLLDAERMTERNQLVRALRRHRARDDRGMEHRSLRCVENCCERSASATCAGKRTRVWAVAVRMVTALSPTSTMVGRAPHRCAVNVAMGQPPM